jgi:hypothetical protein
MCKKAEGTMSFVNIPHHDTLPSLPVWEIKLPFACTPSSYWTMDELFAERVAEMPGFLTIKCDASLKYATMQEPAVESAVNNVSPLLREVYGKFPNKNAATGGPTVMLKTRLEIELSIGELVTET